MTKEGETDFQITLQVDPVVAQIAHAQLTEALEGWDANPEAAKTHAILAIQSMQESNAVPPEERLRGRLTITFDGSKGPKERAKELVESLATALAPDEE